MSSRPADPAFADGPNVAPLAACPVFAPLPGAALRALAELARRRRYEAGEALYRIGDPSDSVFNGELAAQLGVARQSLNRALGELQRRGLIRVVGSGTTIDLLDRMTLRRLAVGDRRPLSPD